MDAYFGEMQNIIDAKNTSSRVRFMLQDLLDLRRNKWNPRREEAGPKTIGQIHQEAEREKTLQQLNNHNIGGMGGGMGGMNSRVGSKSMGRDRDGRGGQDGRKRSRAPQGPGGMQQEQDGWNTVTRPQTKINEKYDPTKLMGLGSSLKRVSSSDGSSIT